MNVEENEKADEAAKETAEMAEERRCLEQLALLTYVGYTITEQKLKEAKY